DNMVADKVEFCKQYGIDITPEQWPTHHLPEDIIADRGEFESYSVDNLINNLNIKIENTTVYRGDLKGIVERKFRTVNGKVKQKVIEKYPVEKEMVAEGLVPTPINLWNWGIQNRTGRLRTIDRNILRLNVLPRGKATISRAGIKFKNLLYGSQRAMEEHWYLK